MSWKCEACGASLDDTKETWNAVHDKIFREIFRCAPHSMTDEARMQFRMSLIMAIVRVYKKNMKASDEVIVRECIDKYVEFVQSEYDYITQ